MPALDLQFKGMKATHSRHHLTELLRGAGSPRNWASAWLYLPRSVDSHIKVMLEFAPPIKTGRTNTDNRLKLMETALSISPFIHPHLLSTLGLPISSSQAKQARQRRKHTVSSLHMEWIWVPNITAVKVKNRRLSRHRKINRITVTGGEKSLHSANKRKQAMSGPQSITNTPKHRSAWCSAHRRTLVVPVPEPAPAHHCARSSTGTFMVHHGAEAVSPLGHKSTPPAVARQLPPHPRFPRQPSLCQLCTDLHGKLGERTAPRPHPASSTSLGRSPRAPGWHIWPTCHPAEGGPISAHLTTSAAVRSDPGRQGPHRAIPSSLTRK